MAVENLEEAFLRLNAGRHFVALMYRLRRGTERHDNHVSCFVVELAGAWFLITAGHWIKKREDGLERALAAGYALERIQLVDSFAGKTSTPLPITFDLSEWAAMYDDDQGIDFAALPLNPLFRRGLEAAGVTAIEPHAMGPAQFYDDSQLVLAGVPRESFKLKRNDGLMKFFLVPLTEYDGHDLPVKGESVLAKMAENPAAGEPHHVEDIAGMSGCPVFRVVNKAGSPKKYWLVGIQSGWYSSRRVIRFCSLDRFVAALEEAGQRFTQLYGGPAGSLT